MGRTRSSAWNPRNDRVPFDLDQALAKRVSLGFYWVAVNIDYEPGGSGPMSNLHQHQGKRNTVPAGETRRRRLGVWLLFGWAMFWLTTGIAQPYCCISLAVGTGGESVTAHQSSDHLADHPGGKSPGGPDCSYLAFPDAISPTAAASAVDRLDPVAAPPPVSGMTARTYGPALLAQYLPVPPPRHVPLYLRNQRFLI
jgi:hypothetical protein